MIYNDLTLVEFQQVKFNLILYIIDPRNPQNALRVGRSPVHNSDPQLSGLSWFKGDPQMTMSSFNLYSQNHVVHEIHIDHGLI